MLAPAPGFTAPFVDLIGKPFAWKGRGPDTFDCYGLVEEIERRHGRRVPDYLSPTTFQTISDLVNKSVSHWTPCEMGPGAVVTIRVGRYVSHVGVVLPHGRMLHSWERSGGVCIERLDQWSARITGAYRFPQD
jgi:cell wall-associated NlpC family hydrolase